MKTTPFFGDFLRDSIDYMAPRGLREWVVFMLRLPGAWFKYRKLWRGE